MTGKPCGESRGESPTESWPAFQEAIGQQRASQAQLAGLSFCHSVVKGVALRRFDAQCNAPSASVDTSPSGSRKLNMASISSAMRLASPSLQLSRMARSAGSGSFNKPLKLGAQSTTHRPQCRRVPSSSLLGSEGRLGCSARLNSLINRIGSARGVSTLSKAERLSKVTKST